MGTIAYGSTKVIIRVATIGQSCCGAWCRTSFNLIDTFVDPSKEIRELDNDLFELE